MSRGARVARTGSGQALVEFALILPIFLILLFGIIDFGRYVYTANSLNNAAREGARIGSVGIRPSPDCDGLSREACTVKIAKSRAYGLGGPGVGVVVSCARIAAGATPPTTPIAVSSCRTDDFIKVHTQSTFTLATPLIGQFFGSLTITGDAQVVVNQ
jgi:hypothetical protein